MLIDKAISIKTKREEEKEPSLFRKNPSTEGIQGHAVSSLLKPAVTCLNDNHFRSEDSWFTINFCTATFYCSLKEGRKPSKLNVVLWLQLFCHVQIFQCLTPTSIPKTFCLRENWLRDNKTGFLESKNKCMTTSECGGHPKRSTPHTWEAISEQDNCGALA